MVTGSPILAVYADKMAMVCGDADLCNARCPRRVCSCLHRQLRREKYCDVSRMRSRGTSLSKGRALTTSSLSSPHKCGRVVISHTSTSGILMLLGQSFWPHKMSSLLKVDSEIKTKVSFLVGNPQSTAWQRVGAIFLTSMLATLCISMAERW